MDNWERIFLVKGGGGIKNSPVGREREIQEGSAGYPNRSGLGYGWKMEGEKKKKKRRDGRSTGSKR